MMRDKMAGALGVVLAVGVLAVSSPALADGAFLSIAPLVANVNGSPGLEMIAPRFTRVDTDGDGAANRMFFRYYVYDMASNTLAYATPQKMALYPDLTARCPIGAPYRDVDENGEPVFLRAGKWLVTAIRMTTECSTSTSSAEDVNTFVYVADVSGPNKAVRYRQFNHAYLIGAELHDVDGNGSKELMLSMISENGANTYMRLYAMALASGSVILDHSYLVDQEK